MFRLVHGAQKHYLYSYLNIIVIYATTIMLFAIFYQILNKKKSVI